MKRTKECSHADGWIIISSDAIDDGSETEVLLECNSLNCKTIAVALLSIDIVEVNIIHEAKV